MNQSDEPITVYGFMFGDESADWTIGQLDQTLRALSDRTLFQVASLGTVLDRCFHLAFGPSDQRYQAVNAVTFTFVADELERRGYDSPGDIELAFDEWRAWMVAGGPDVDAIPTHRLSRMRATIRDASARLGPGSEPDGTARLGEAQAAVDGVLRQRGVLADDRDRGRFQA